MGDNRGILPQLGVVEVATPCPARWEQMQGDRQVRHCGECRRNVYDLSALTAEEARQLLNRTEGRMCVRFFVRADGRMLTRDCPTGVAARLRRRVAALAASLAALFAGALQAIDREVEESAPAAPVAHVARGPVTGGPVVPLDWADQRRKASQLQYEPRPIQGMRIQVIGVIRGTPSP